MKKVKHPSLYEINTRVLLSQYNKNGVRATLRDIPDGYWQNLADLGINWVWLMGVWTLKEKQTDPNLIPDHMLEEFKLLLPDLTDDDIDGSTYAIDDYTVDPVIGGEKELLVIRKKLNQIGIHLMLDFIPNHLGAHTHYMHTHPEYFIQIDFDNLEINSLNKGYLNSIFYSPDTQKSTSFAHGKDPYFDAWQDTIQINYGAEKTRAWMTAQLLSVAKLCDGVRCDMAMLAVKRIFIKTWGDFVSWEGSDFWDVAIKQIKDAFPDFLFLAEVYWDMEAELLSMGFDFCYDKTFYDRLTDPNSLNAHFRAEPWYLAHTARFLENHDEERIASRLELRQHMASAALVAFGPGMRFWHMGQWEGRTKRIPVQLNRAPIESCECLLDRSIQNSCKCLSDFYHTLLFVTNLDILKNGDWSRISINPEVSPGLFIWQWQDDIKSIIVAINYSGVECTIDPKQLGLSPACFEKSLFQLNTDAYAGMQLCAWDIRAWESIPEI